MLGRTNNFFFVLAAMNIYFEGSLGGGGGWGAAKICDVQRGHWQKLLVFRERGENVKGFLWRPLLINNDRPIKQF